MKNKLLTYSFDNKLSHIPSALSMLDYVEVLFKERIVTPTDGIVIGKPFGAQAYYVVWEELGYITNINQLSVGVKHDEIPFVDYADETIGNALGVSIGIALTTHKRIWVNLSDASLQMGNILEAIQFIGQHNLRNIFVTIDYNNAQVTGHTTDIISVEPCKNFFAECGWIVHSINGHNKQELSKTFNSLDASRPNVVFCNTTKGNGVQCMVEDIQKWHYRKISSLEELESMI
jgi:transketolase N-terminal domain/subunit